RDRAPVRDRALARLPRDAPSDRRDREPDRARSRRADRRAARYAIGVGRRAARRDRADRRERSASRSAGGLMTSVAVIAHSGKRLGRGLTELRSTLRDRGVDDPLWSEVPKSKFAPDRVAKGLQQGADPVFASGGGGLVARSRE